MKASDLCTLEDIMVKNQTVLVRLDINSPLNRETGEIIDDTRIVKSVSTISYLVDNQAKVVLLAHQGDSLDYQNFTSLEQHAAKLMDLLGQQVMYIDDICSDYVYQKIAQLRSGEVLLLGNIRYLSEEISAFEKDVTLTPRQMTNTWLYRCLSPLIDVYVNEAFSAAHRNAPSLIAFQQNRPAAVGRQYYEEISHLETLLNSQSQATYYVLGGAKISDAFGMISEILRQKRVKMVLTTGVVGMVFLAAKGYDLGKNYMEFLSNKGFLSYIDQAANILELYADFIAVPRDVAYQSNSGLRKELSCGQMAEQNASYLDIGKETISEYKDFLEEAEIIFANGPAGVYEQDIFELGTQQLFQAIANSTAFSVIGGGDTVTAAKKYIDLADISYVSTAGGAMIQYLSGKKLPVVQSMNEASQRLRKEGFVNDKV